MPTYPVIQRRPLPEPRAHITDQDAVDQAIGSFNTGNTSFAEALKTLESFIDEKGDITHLLDRATVSEIGISAVREWHSDRGSIDEWLEQATQGLDAASMAHGNGETKNYPWDDAANIHYPILTNAANHWAAMAYPELIRGDKVVGVKVYEPEAASPSKVEQLTAAANRIQAIQQSQAQMQQAANPQAPPQPDPQIQQQLLQIQQAIQQAQFQEVVTEMATEARNSRARRVAQYMNWLIFQKMNGWENETDQMLSTLPITGSTFKKVYMGDNGLCSDYIDPRHLTVHNDTRNIYECPRITYDFEMYPFQLEEAQRSGRFRWVELPIEGEDTQQPRQIIEQLRMEDLDGDGLVEPYMVTVDADTSTTLRIEPAFGRPDIQVSEKRKIITGIVRYNYYPDFKFLPDPRGGFYGTGFAKLLGPMTDSINASINQLMDAGTAEIAGGGFIGAGVRLQGSGQGGTIWFRPGEYQTVSTVGGAVKDAFYERTVPSPSAVTMELLQMMIESAKEIASIKDVMTGDGNNMAAVGTTLAMQDQALKVFSAIYKRVYRGFRDEFRLMYRCLANFGTDREKKQYLELTGGDFTEDFSGDGTDIQPVADPQVVSKYMKVAQVQALRMLAESPVGQAAGMLQPQAAQELAKQELDAYDIDRPGRFIGPVPPNPLQAAEVQAKVQLTQAQAQKAQTDAAKNQADIGKIGADTTLLHAKTTREVGLTAIDAEEIRSGHTGRAADAATDKTEAETQLTHAKTIREVGLSAIDAHEIRNPQMTTEGSNATNNSGEAGT